jgi:DNA/RNA endonuclease YhcR with UshA esterase domain
MKEGQILGLSLAVSTMGLVLLFFLSGIQDPVPVSYISPDDIGSRVYVKGEVSNVVASAEGHVFLTLQDDSGSVKVAIFKSVTKNVYCLDDGRSVALRGTVDEFRGEIEIVPAKARDIEC